MGTTRESPIGLFEDRPVRAIRVALILALWAAPALGEGVGSDADTPGGTLITTPVLRREFAHDVASRGAVESSVNVEVRCEVRLNWSWIRILDVVAEGTRVKPGDFLVRLDSSSFETDRVRQEIYCHQAKIFMEQARAAHDNAKQERDLYLGGEYRLAKLAADARTLAAEEQFRRAKDYLKHSRELQAQGFITRQRLGADEFAFAAAETQLKLAQHQLDVLEQYTKPARLRKIASTFAVSRARLTAAELNDKIQQNMLADVDEQIRKCVVVAPVAGEVVLAHIRQDNHSHLIQPGEQTMERRTLVRLPDCRHMQVKAKIPEDDVALVKPGMIARIRLDAHPDTELTGSVMKVNDFPEATEWMDSATKLYETVIRIDKPFEGMKPGLTADVQVRVRQIDDQLQVPLQAVLTEGGKHFCLVQRDGEVEAQPVEIGPKNAIMAVVSRGLNEGQTVVVNAASHRRGVALSGGEALESRSSRGERAASGWFGALYRPRWWACVGAVLAAGLLVRFVRQSLRAGPETVRV
jgi:HlyD family secretion protein